MSQRPVPIDSRTSAAASRRRSSLATAIWVPGRDLLLEPDRGTVRADPGDPDVGLSFGQEPVRPGGVRAHLVRDLAHGRQRPIELSRMQDVELDDGDREGAGEVG